MKEFKPNYLTEKDVDDLEPWQLLVAACHFGPQMGDCVQLNYGYTIDKDGIIFCGKISLEDDIDLKHPEYSLETYAGFKWTDWAKKMIKEAVKDTI